MKQILTLIALSFVLGGCAVGSVKEPSFTVVEKQDNIEIRRYDPMIVAEVTMTGDRKEAINNGFRALADYIFGNNDGGAKIAMTAPVIQQSNDKGVEIAMTAPVIQQPSNDANTWKIQFVLPAEYTMDTIPKPINKDVKLIQRPSYDAAVIRFSGWAGTETLDEKTKALETWVAAKGLTGIEKPVYAFYNPPWILPFLRRNEVMITLAPKK